ncbi:DUF6114 domain-containing protein [Plantactinospora sp. GCM10030261]|uniref:DUF6114 domain-containing protein n=1 Tax=Plantactinospora sp. GCM10030261 TaxID=3273420 RepID=UPI00361CA385
MTTADAQRSAAVEAFVKGRRAFRWWRRTRPFWGGLLTVIAGAEIFGTTQLSLGGLTFQMGPTGFLSWLIPTILITCGFLLWFTPQQRMFYAIVAAVTAVFSLVAINLGGFFIGMLLGMVGGALGFAWTPVREPAGPAADTGTPPEGSARRPPHMLAVLLLATMLTATGLLVVDRGEPARAAPCPSPSGPATSGQPSVPARSPSGPTASGRPSVPARAPRPTRPTGPSRSPAPSATPTTPAGSDPDDGNLLTDLLSRVREFLAGGSKKTATATASPEVTPTFGAPAPRSASPKASSGKPAATTSAPSVVPTVAIPGCAPRPEPSRTAGATAPTLAADSDTPTAANVPSRLTGSRLTMKDLRFEGIVRDFRTAAGPIAVLKFTMSRAITTDFALQIQGPPERSLRYESPELTVQGNVEFYTTRFVGRILGIKITLTPDSPLPPDGIDLTVPVSLTFTDADIQLALIDCDTLSVTPSLNQRLA